jgi:hypothetical protein
VLRKWLSPRSSLIFGTGLSAPGAYQSGDSYQPRAIGLDGMGKNGQPNTVTSGSSPPLTWRGQLWSGASHTLGDTVTLGFALNLGDNLVYRGEIGPFSAHSNRANLTLGLGAVQSVGLRPLHLVQVHVNDWMAINLDAALEYRFATRLVDESYTAGASFVW